VRFKKILLSALVCTAVMASYSFAQGEGADDDFEYENPSWINNVPPTSFWGLRGLTQTVSAEPLGVGRFNMAIFGSYFPQKQNLTAVYRDGQRGSLLNGTNVTTMRGALSYGMNEQFDIFGIMPMYILSGGGVSEVRSSLTGLLGGVQYAFPIPQEIPFRLAAQMQFAYGMRTGPGTETNNLTDVTYNPEYTHGSDRINQDKKPGMRLSYAGYDYFEARKNDNFDVILKSAQSLVAGNIRRSAKLHFNEGVSFSPGVVDVGDWLLHLGGGAEIAPTEFLTIGLEFNWRTVLSRWDMADPFWFTPSLMFRSPYYSEGLFGMSFIAGMDFALSQKPDDKTTKSLEDWRIFGDLVFSFDFMASKRAEIARLARENAAEKARLRKQAALTSAQKDSVARKAHEDSMRLAAEMAQRAQADSIRAKAVADSLAALMDDQMLRARQDSLALAQSAAQREAELTQSAAQREAHLRAEAERKRVADSLALAETQRRLEEEKTKRSEAEQMMLSTGMLVLDGVYFTTNKADIQLNSRGYLTTIARMLVKYPKLRLEIGGHTDNVGKFETNMALSQKRAEAVFIFLHNVDPALAPMLSAKGYGPTMPKADNATAAGREINRRVEIKVLNPEVLKEYNK